MRGRVRLFFSVSGRRAQSICESFAGCLHGVHCCMQIALSDGGHSVQPTTARVV